MSAAAEDRWIGPGIDSLGDINVRISAPILAPGLTWRWWTAFAISGALTAMMVAKTGSVRSRNDVRMLGFSRRSDLKGILMRPRS